MTVDERLIKIREQLNALIAEIDALRIEPVFDLAVEHLVVREGFRTTVYRDSLGVPTVGVGHVVRPEDNLKVGDAITKERAYAFLHSDARNAFEAANSQFNELGLDDFTFIIALTSVNFQLGTGWTNKFPKTWALIKNGQYEEAAKEAANSLWARQTPVRVKDFQEALMKLRSN